MDRVRIEELERLAGLELGDGERESLRGDLAAIMSLADGLPEVEGTPGTEDAPVPRGRNDVPREGVDPMRARVLAAAPAVRDDRFVVPGLAAPGSSVDHATAPEREGDP